MLDRTTILQDNFIRRVRAGDLPALASSYAAPDNALLVELFESQLLSRHLDYQARLLQARGEAFYTIGSSGHEGNAAIAAAFRPDDMAFLHYRDAAFMIQRSKRVAGQNIMRDMLLSFAASKDDPISGGRHKVLGSKALCIPPQTSTIASHLPKAVGMATSIGLNRRLKHAGAVPPDSVVICSFGDASLNHSTAQGAINTASWTAYQKIHMPIVFVCADNGIGISTPTPEGWVHASMHAKPGIHYINCNGLDLADTYRAACEAEAYVRKTRLPVFLHMRCVRLLGHAGSDAPHTYLSEEQIEAMESHDPLLYSAHRVIAAGAMSADEVLKRYNTIAEEVMIMAEEVITRPKLSTAKEVMESIVPPRRVETKIVVDKAARESCFADDMRQLDKPYPMARLLSFALTDIMLERPHTVLAGEDIGKKGGVYSVTTGLQKRFGRHRVIDTLLDEQTILGMAIGMGQNHLLPIVEIQFLAYLHNAEDQLRGEAATLSFFSSGQYTNPMVVRIAGLPYQKGFGGHFHNDNSLAVLRDIPGIIVACPSNGADAVHMLRECVRLADEEQRVVVFVEPIALYMTKDLYEPKDGLMSVAYGAISAQAPVPYGSPAVYGEGKELCILTYGNGVFLSRQAEKTLREEHNLSVRVVDMRWLVPLHMDNIIEAIGPCTKILIVDECRSSGSISEEVMARLHETVPSLRTERITAEDCFIPLGKAATATLPSKETIVKTALAFHQS